ncbi:MAG TPA: hypothetical protein VGN90_05755 [Pyrinomonadaceae bacterium]|nr:hypothetical protein [Pyrinomonadaceae bacterium]
MAKINEIYVREIRDNLKRFPVWPPGQKPFLGQVGFYNGRRASFDWKTDLAALGLTMPAPQVGHNQSEFYSSKNAVSYKYSLSAANLGEASFKFGRSGAIAARSKDMELVSVPIGPLEKELAKAIANNRLNWNKKWVIVTAIYRASSYTALISSSNRSTASLSTSLPITGLYFDIADPKLGVAVTASEYLHYQTVAEAGAEPFFQIHKLFFQDNGQHYLKPYGMDRGWLSLW